MKIVLKDMTIEGEPDEIAQFLSIKKSSIDTKKPLMVYQDVGNIVGTYIKSEHSANQ